MTVVPLPLEQNQHADTLIHGADGGSEVRRSVLPGGVRVLTEAMPGQRSATIGFWVGVGSRDEAPGQHGSTHFLEHLLFKGTQRRTALEIASAFDEVGGESNAATAKESTCYFARVLDTDLPMAIDVIADMITGAVLDPQEMEQERDVILEEIAMDSDDPTDVAHEHFVAAVLGTHPLGRPIGGTPDAIRAVARDSVWDHYRRYYRPDELVITAAGGLDHDVVCGLVVDALHSAGWSLEPDAAPVQRRSTDRAAITGTAGLHVVKRPVEQANIIMGCPTHRRHRRPPLCDERAQRSPGRRACPPGCSRKSGRSAAWCTRPTPSPPPTPTPGTSACTPAAPRRRSGRSLSCSAPNWTSSPKAASPRRNSARPSGSSVAESCWRWKTPAHGCPGWAVPNWSPANTRTSTRRLRQIKAVTADEVQVLARELAAAPRTVTVVGPFDENETFGL